MSTQASSGSNIELAVMEIMAQTGAVQAEGGPSAAQKKAALEVQAMAQAFEDTAKQISSNADVQFMLIASMWAQEYKSMENTQIQGPVEQAVLDLVKHQNDLFNNNPAVQNAQNAVDDDNARIQHDEDQIDNLCKYPFADIACIGYLIDKAIAEAKLKIDQATLTSVHNLVLQESVNSISTQGSTSAMTIQNGQVQSQAVQGQSESLASLVEALTSVQVTN